MDGALTNESVISELVFVRLYRTLYLNLNDARYVWKANTHRVHMSTYKCTRAINSTKNLYDIMKERNKIWNANDITLHCYDDNDGDDDTRNFRRKLFKILIHHINIVI